MSSEMKPFNPKHTVKVPTQMVSKLQFGLTANAMKLAIAIIDNIDASVDAFPRNRISITNYKNHLGLDENPNYIKTIERAFDELDKNSLRYARTTTARTTIPWFGFYDIDEKTREVIFEINEYAKPLLLGFKQYIPFLNETVVGMKGKYTHALYLQLMQYFGQWRGESFSTIELNIDELIRYFRIENEKSYKEGSSGRNQKFFNNVIGIAPPQKGKKWAYYKGAKKNQTFALEEINKKSNYSISAEPLKTAHSYDRIKFIIGVRGGRVLTKNAKKAAKKEVFELAGQLSIDDAPKHSIYIHNYMDKNNFTSEAAARRQAKKEGWRGDGLILTHD